MKNSKRTSQKCFAYPAAPAVFVRWWTVLVASWLLDAPRQTVADWDFVAGAAVDAADPSRRKTYEISKTKHLLLLLFKIKPKEEGLQTSCSLNTIYLCNTFEEYTWNKKGSIHFIILSTEKLFKFSDMLPCS